MPNLVVYVPASVWRRMELIEGQAVKKVARSIAKEAIIEYAAKTAPGGSQNPSGVSGAKALTAGYVTGAGTSEEER